jgi:hypothetical protein
MRQALKKRLQKLEKATTALSPVFLSIENKTTPADAAEMVRLRKAGRKYTHIIIEPVKAKNGRAVLLSASNPDGIQNPSACT